MRCDTLDYFLCGGWQKKSPATEGERTYLSGNKDSNNLSNNKISSTDNFEDVCEVLRNDENIFPREQYPLQPIGTAQDYGSTMPQVEGEDKGLKRNSIFSAREETALGSLAPAESAGGVLHVQADFSKIENPKENPNEITELPIWALPDDIQSIIGDVTKGYRCNRDFVVGSLMGAVACLIGKRVVVHSGNYKNHATLWLALIGDSSEGKSQPLDFFFKPIQDEEDDAYNRYQEELQQWKDNDCKGVKPVHKHRIIDNLSDEAVLRELAVNGDITWFADELRVIFEGFGSYKTSGAGVIVGNLLKIFQYGSINVSRVSSEPVRLKEPHLNLIGGIQPETLKRVMRNKGFTEDGLFQRMLWDFPKQKKRPPRTKHIISDKSKKRWGEYAKHLSTAAFEDMFETADAEKLHDDVLEKWDIEIEEYRKEGIPEMVSLISKLNYHLCRWCACVAVLRGEQRIEEDVMRYSIECMEYFKWCGERAMCLLHNEPCKRETTKGDVIKLLKKFNQNLSQQKIAEVMGCSQPYVNKILNQ